MKQKITLTEILRSFLGHRDNWIFITAIVGGAIFLLMNDPRWGLLGWYLLGWLIFFPQEYLTHRIILHPPVPKNRFFYGLVYRMHYGHHQLPKRLDLMYMPSWLILFLSVFNIAFMWLITVDSLSWVATIIGAYTGYLVFEWSHLLCHVPYKAKSKWLQAVRRRHMLHHYHNEHHWYTVSIPAMVFDVLFGTAGSNQTVVRTTTAASMGLSDDHPFNRWAQQKYADNSDGDLLQSAIWLDMRGVDEHSSDSSDITRKAA